VPEHVDEVFKFVHTSIPPYNIGEKC
jgi:hypothetical protein